MLRYAALMVSLAAVAGAQSPVVINTDRPAFADSSTVVPKDSVVIENGFLDSSTQVNQAGKQTLDFPESQFRFGLFDKTELRFSAPDYFNGPLSGFSDISAGIKQQLGPIAGFDLSVVVGFSFPTGGKHISSHGYDPSLQIPWSRKLSANWTAGGMVAVSRPTAGEATFYLDRQLTSPWDVFIEYGGIFPERGGPQHILHFGTSYKLTPHQQVDLHGGVGLSAAAPDHFIGFGYSILLHAPTK
jgi:hypothetical protein